jgi:hypothetical protein
MKGIFGVMIFGLCVCAHIAWEYGDLFDQEGSYGWDIFYGQIRMWCGKQKLLKPAKLALRLTLIEIKKMRFKLETGEYMLKFIGHIIIGVHIIA